MANDIGVLVLGDNSVQVITGDQIPAYRLKCLVIALETHVKFGGKLRVKGDYMGCARRLGYVGRTAKALLADIISKNPGIR